MSIQLLEHNQKTFNEVLNFIDKEQNCCVVNPCGSGKTYIMAALIEHFYDKKFLIITKQANARDYYNNKEVVFNRTDIITYNTLWNSYKNKRIKEFKYDFVIVDEAHYSGANKWSIAIDYLKENTNALIVGFTATPQRFEQQGTESNIIEEFFDNHVAGNFTSVELQKKGVFIEPECIVSYHNLNHEIDTLIERATDSDLSESRIESLINRLNNIRKKWEEESCPSIIIGKHLSSYLYKDKCNRILVYSSGVEMLHENIKEIQDIFNERFSSLNIKYYEYTYKTSDEEYKNFLEEDNETDIKVLFSIDKIMETIHIDDLSIVIMLRPSISDRIIKQQYGRVNNINNKNRSLILDFVGNIDRLGIYRVPMNSNGTEIRIRKTDIFNININYIREYKSIFDSIDKQLNRDNIYEYKGITGNIRFFSRIFNCDERMVKSNIDNGMSLEDAIINSNKINEFNDSTIQNIVDIKHTFEETANEEDADIDMNTKTQVVSRFIRNRNVKDEDICQDLYLMAYSTKAKSGQRLYAKLSSKYVQWCKVDLNRDNYVEKITEFEQDKTLKNEETNMYYDEVLKEINRYMNEHKIEIRVKGINPLTKEYEYERVRSKNLRVSKRNQGIFYYRFGIYTDTQHTLDETAEEFNVTRERVRQICLQAIRQLRNDNNLVKLYWELDNN